MNLIGIFGVTMLQFNLSENISIPQTASIQKDIIAESEQRRAKLVNRYLRGQE
jgi:hypothetical protein